LLNKEARPTDPAGLASIPSAHKETKVCKKYGGNSPVAVAGQYQIDY